MKIIPPSLKANRCFEFDLSGTKLSIEVPPIRSQYHYKGIFNRKLNIYQDLVNANPEFNRLSNSLYEGGWGFKTGFMFKSHIGDLSLHIGLRSEKTDSRDRPNCFIADELKQQIIQFSKELIDKKCDQGGPTSPDQIEELGNDWFRYVDFIPESKLFKQFEAIRNIHYATPISEHIILDFHFKKSDGFNNHEQRDALYAEHDKLIEYVMSKVKLELSEDAKHQKAQAQSI